MRVEFQKFRPVLQFTLSFVNKLGQNVGTFMWSRHAEFLAIDKYEMRGGEVVSQPLRRTWEMFVMMY